MSKKLILCAGNNEIWDFATIIGVGLINSSINLSKILTKALYENNMPTELIFIGTCGLYQKGNIFDIITSNNASNIEISELLDFGYSPIVSRETNFIINSSNIITTDEKIAMKFANLGFLAENMEFFSVCEVAKNFDIKAKGIFCATNYCNKNARANFIKNHKKAMEILEKYIKEYL